MVDVNARYHLAFSAAYGSGAAMTVIHPLGCADCRPEIGISTIVDDHVRDGHG